MYENLHVIDYPDPRLRRVAKPVQQFDQSLTLLTQRLFELMREHKGVGLAAPQIGVDQCVFVMNHSGELADDRAYVNPELFDSEGTEEAEEGCLSLPGINATIFRGKKLRLVAYDVHGRPIEQTESGYIARIWQHEFDHLNGVLIIDRMGAVAKMSFRKKLREMEAKFGKNDGR